MCHILIFTGREKHLIQAKDPDNKQQIFLYDIHSESGNNTLVPLDHGKFRQYHSIRGKKVLEEERLYYKYGRENNDGDIMKRDIGLKIVILEALRDTLQSLKNGYKMCYGGTVFPREVASNIENFRPSTEANLTVARKILESLKKDYPQIFQEMGSMGSLEKLPKQVRDLEMQMTIEKDSWDRLFSMEHTGIDYEDFFVDVGSGWWTGCLLERWQRSVDMFFSSVFLTNTFYWSCMERDVLHVTTNTGP